MTDSHATDIIIIGAGLAGLSAAVTAQRAGFSVKVFESSSAVGGRIKTDVIDGFRFDHGFQVFNPAYPAAKNILNYEALALRSFSPGIKLLEEDSSRLFGNPLRDPQYALSFIKNLKNQGIQGATDLARFGAYAAACAAKKDSAVFDTSARSALLQAGMSPHFVDGTMAPFLTGVFLEPNLETSRRFLDFVLANFIKGVPAIPADGMQAIPHHLHSLLHSDVVQLNSGVHSISDNTVVTDSGGYKARTVIVATDQDTAQTWSGIKATGWRSVTTWYHAVDCAREQLADGQGRLTIDTVTNRGPVINSVPISHVAASYAPTGQHLISSSTLGTDTSLEMANSVKKHLGLMYGLDTSQWNNIAVYPIAKALPIATPPHITLANPQIAPNVYLAGDYTISTSINGAIESGVLAAKAALQNLRNK